MEEPVSENQPSPLFESMQQNDDGFWVDGSEVVIPPRFEGAFRQTEDKAARNADKKTLHSWEVESTKDAVFSFPLELNWKRGLALATGSSSCCDISYNIPPAYSQAKWSADIRSTTAIRGPMGSSCGSVLLRYMILVDSSWLYSNFVVSPTKPFSVVLGVNHLLNNCILLNFGYSTAKKSPILHTSFQYTIAKAIDFTATISASGSFRLPTLQIFASRHDEKVQINVQRNKKAFQADAFLQLDDWLPFRSLLTVSLGHGSSLSEASFDVGLCHKLSSVATFGFSLSQSLLGNGLRWIVSFERNQVQVRVPIDVTGFPDLLGYWTQLGCLSLIGSGIALFANQTASATQLQGEQLFHKRRKEEEDSRRQQMLMKSRAQIAVDKENQSNGLVIEAGIYQCSSNKLDVTIPLRFWTSKGILELPAGSKANLLGFHDVSIISDDESVAKTSMSISRLLNSTHLMPPEQMHTKRAETFSSATTLLIKYRYASKPYQVLIKDDEPLSIP